MAKKDVLVDYLKKILVEQDASVLTEDEIPKEKEKFSQGLQILQQWLKENADFAKDIAMGNLNCAEPSEENPFCDSLKALRSSLSHLVWQTKQVAGGDYSQKVAMLGEFSDAFNTMTGQLKQRETALMEQNALLSCITDNIGEYLVVLDEETKEILYANKAFIDLSVEEAQVADILREFLEEYSIDDNSRSWEKSFRMPDDTERVMYYHMNSFYIDWQGRYATAHLLKDVTDQKEWESSIEYAANTDALTGLYNRCYCMEILSKYINEQTSFSVCFADLDRLKVVNDKYGHASGDEYILMAAEVLKEAFREEDIICRIGGDEFVIILQEGSNEYMEMRMKQVRGRLKQIAVTGDYPYAMGISYGIINYDGENISSAEEALENADQKMYIFKQEHRE